MRLSDALGIRAGDLVALVGAGGKTSALRRIAAEWAADGKRVLLSTTTKIEAQRGEIRTVFVPVAGHRGNSPRSAALPPLSFEPWGLRQAWPIPQLLVREELPDIARLRGLPPEEIDALAMGGLADLIVVQADGASRRAFKAPSEHEPVVPSHATLVVAVLGVDAFGHPIDDERCHRPGRVAKLGGAAIGDLLTPKIAARVHSHPDGPFRATPPKARRAVLVNKVEGPKALATARAFAAALRSTLRSAQPVPIVLAAVRADPPVVEVLWTRANVSHARRLDRPRRRS